MSWGAAGKSLSAQLPGHSPGGVINEISCPDYTAPEAKAAPLLLPVSFLFYLEPDFFNWIYWTDIG